MRYIGLTVFLCLALSLTASGDTIAVWNFNDASAGLPDSFLVDRGIGMMTSDFGSGVSSGSGTSVNSQEGDAGGYALRLAGSVNNGKHLVWDVDLTGFAAISVSFAAVRTSSGFNDNLFQYTTNSGDSWIDVDDFVPGSAFGSHIFDLSGIAELDDNPNARFRIVFRGATSQSGNNRIDNLAVCGSAIPPLDPTPVPEPTTLALTGIGLAYGIARNYRRLHFRTYNQSTAG